MEYRKEKKEMVDQYKGYQTMESKDHPVVIQAQKAKDLTSQVI